MTNKSDNTDLGTDLCQMGPITQMHIRVPNP